MERVGERIALTKCWVLDKLVENLEKAMRGKSGSPVANRALELVGTELGMFRNDEPRKPITLDGRVRSRGGTPEGEPQVQ